jgi:hypothetical protein
LLDPVLAPRHRETVESALAVRKGADALPGFDIFAAVLGIATPKASIEGASVAEMSQHVGAALVGAFLGNLVAYPEFVTAMIARYLVMYFVAAGSKERRAALFESFRNPSREPRRSIEPTPEQAGPGGASTRAINLRGGLDAPRTQLVACKPACIAVVAGGMK